MSKEDRAYEDAWRPGHINATGGSTGGQPPPPEPEPEPEEEPKPKAKKATEPKE